MQMRLDVWDRGTSKLGFTIYIMFMWTVWNLNVNLYDASQWKQGYDVCLCTKTD